MFYTIVWIITAFILLLLCLPFAAVALAVRGSSPAKPESKLATALIRIGIPIIMWAQGMKWDVKGKENLPQDGRAVLYVGNHQGNFDMYATVMFFVGIPSVVAKIEASKVPVANMLMKATGAIFMDRGNPRETVKSIKLTQEALEAGHSVLIFPEGTRSRGPQMGEFKAGALKGALAAGVDIVPFAIDGTYKLFEETGRVKPGTAKLHIMPAVSTKDFANTKELAAALVEKIQAELDLMRAEA